MLLPFFVRKDKKLLPLNPENVLYLRALGNYTEVVVLPNQKTHLARATLLNALRKMPPDLFIQTHRGWAVSKLHITKVEKETVIVGKTEIPISRKYYKRVLEQLNVIE